MIPDVWSYPCLFQPSNPRRNIHTEETKPLNRRKDVFVDLGRAPPRFQESIISEEFNEEHAESMLNQDSIGDTDEAHSKQFDLPDLVMTQVEEELLEEASSFFNGTTKDTDIVNRETSSDTSKDEDTDSEDEELIASRKGLGASSVDSGEEEIGIMTLQTAVADNLQEKQADLISELVLAEEMYQSEESGVTVFDEHVSEEDVWNEDSVTSVSTIDGSDTWVVVPVNSMKESKNHRNGVVEDRKGIGFVLGTPGQFSFKNGCSQSKHEKEESGTACFVKNGVFDHCKPEHSTTGVYSKTSLLDEGRCDNQQAFPDEQANLCLALQQDPFMGTGPFQDQSPTPSPSGLRFDESKFDNIAIDLVDFVEGGTALEGSDDQASLSSTPEKCEHDDEIGVGNQSEELRLVASLNFAGDAISTPDKYDDSGDGIGSHMVSLDFVESSDTDTASEMSEEDEPLWSTFPEYFQRSRRLEYSGKNQGVLLLAEEGQDDEDSLNSTETDQDVALVSLKEFHSKDVDSRYSLDTRLIENEVFADKDLEELSTASSDSFEYTYEVNTESASEDEMVIANDDHDSLKEKKEESNQENHEYKDNTNDLPLCISFTSSNTCFSDKCDILLDARSSFNSKRLKVDELMPSFSTENTVLSSPRDESDFYEKARVTEIERRRKKPTKLIEPSCRKDGSDGPSVSFDDSFKHNSERKETILQGFRSLSDSLLEIKPSLKDLDRSYSPTDWIVPAPPTPTPELQEDDIQIVSPPPPICQALSEKELDEELKHLIVPPPPSLAGTMQTMSSIKIVSPPPPPPVPVDINNNEIDVLMYHFDEIRFLPSTDDHNLAHNNGLMQKQNSDSNFTEDKKIQAKEVMRDASSMTKEKNSLSKQVSVQHKHSYVLNMCEANPTQTKVEQRCKSRVPRSHFLGDSEGSVTTRQSPDKGKSVVEDSLNSENINPPALDSADADKDENVNSSRASEQIPVISHARQENVSFGSGSKIAVKQKPPLPPKPWLSQAAESEGVTEARNVIPTKVIEFSSNNEHNNAVKRSSKNVPNEESFSTELAEPDMSMLGFEPLKENISKDSNNRSASRAATASQVGAPKHDFREVLEPEMCEKMNSGNVEVEPSEVVFMKLSSEPSTENTCRNSGQETSARPVAFRPVIPSVNREQTLPTSQIEQSPSTTVENIINTHEVNTQHCSSGFGRSFSFSCTSAYVPVPYSPTLSPTQSLYPSQSSMENVHESSLHYNRFSPLKPPVTYSMGTCSRLPWVKPRSATSPVTASLPSSDELLLLRRPPLKRLSARLPESNGDKTINPCKDDSDRVLLKSSVETPNCQFPTYSPFVNSDDQDCIYNVDPGKDFANNVLPSTSSPPLDSSPPPLPPTSPPKIIPGFEDDFDFGEPLADIGQDCPQIDSWEQSTFKIPSSAKALKSRRSSASFCHKRGILSDSVHITQTTFPDSYSSSRSLTQTSSSRVLNRRSFSDASHSHVGTFGTKRPSLPLQLGTPCNPDNVTDADSLYFETKYLETKCSEVCEASLSKVGHLKKRLEAHLGKRTPRVKLSIETKNWLLVLQNNARFLACDVKVISSSAKRGGAQVVAAIRASLDSLEKLVESCENATTILNESSTDNVSPLVSMVLEVLEHYAGVITTVKAATVEQADDSNVEFLAEKTSAMAKLIATLIRTLRKY